MYRQPAQGRASLVLDHVDLSQLADRDDEAAEAKQEAPRLFELPTIDVSVKEVWLEGKVIGDLQMSLESDGPVVRAKGIQGQLAGLQLLPEQPAELTWNQGQNSELQAMFHFSDFGDTLDQLGYAPFLETKKGQLELQLTWPGAPQTVSLASLNGALKLDVERGRFLETPAGTGALQVVEIVNLANVLSSLSLSHMFESGINFHSMDGEVLFHSGTLEVPGLNVEGSSSTFVVSGLSDVASQTLDAELVATLPVANNLPWVAALAAGLPVAAGVFVVSKVFEKQVNRLSSGIYSIKGTWDDPQINFDRIFDDELRPSEGAPVATDSSASSVNASVGDSSLDTQEPADTAEPDSLDRVSLEPNVPEIVPAQEPVDFQDPDEPAP
jgi:uncharacterized protein YhdP